VPSEPPLSLPFGGEESYRRAVREKYNAVEIWPQSDRWLTHVKEFIAATLAEWRPKLGLTPASRILNAGSGDESYNVSPGMVVDCDIADRKLVGLPHGVAGDITRLPLRSGAVDCCVCVGSVVNYVDVTRAIEEIARVVKPEGKVVLEFESSRSLEYVFTRHFGEDATRVSTFYIYENENIWVYHEEHVRKLLAQAGFRVVAERRAHFMAPLFYRFRKDLHWAARFAVLDKFVSWMPFLRRHSANVIFLCERRPLH
jgi:SAM-dependent methyltransferase